jgi:hypothetical protein
VTDFDGYYDDDDMLGPPREEPDFDAIAAEELAGHEDAEHGGGRCDCPPAPWPDIKPGDPGYAEEAPY